MGEIHSEITERTEAHGSASLSLQLYRPAPKMRPGRLSRTHSVGGRRVTYLRKDDSSRSDQQTDYHELRSECTISRLPVLASEMRVMSNITGKGRITGSDGRPTRFG